MSDGIEDPRDMEYLSNCCGAPFADPGWPDNDICSRCKEHADIEQPETEDPETKYYRGHTTYLERDSDNGGD